MTVRGVTRFCFSIQEIQEIEAGWIVAALPDQRQGYMPAEQVAV
jgi:hypothetical protein